MSWKHVLSLLLIIVCITKISFAQPEASIRPIKALKDITPKRIVFDEAGKKTPIVIRSESDAEKYLVPDELKKLGKQVNFGKQIVLVFAWRGSGQDRLEYSVLESFPEQIVFSFKPGRTRDLRPHVRVFALRANVKWNGKPANASGPAAKDKEYIKVEVKGKLNSQVFAIGGETTGVQISANGVVWELDLGKNAALKKAAAELNEKVVVVTGTLNVKAGVEIRKRWIVTVATLRDATAGNRKVEDKAR